mmetsp:Transcript_31547/g.66047  ORF Transcript_31547/g.66047 Transcript_31547/m.66047 type:complete len:206 (+) Transcript_31547:363-980(+)
MLVPLLLRSLLLPLPLLLPPHPPPLRAEEEETSLVPSKIFRDLDRSGVTLELLRDSRRTTLRDTRTSASSPLRLSPLALPLSSELDPTPSSPPPTLLLSRTKPSGERSLLTSSRCTSSLARLLRRIFPLPTWSPSPDPWFTVTPSVSISSMMPLLERRPSDPTMTTPWMLNARMVSSTLLAFASDSTKFISGSIRRIECFKMGVV